MSSWNPGVFEIFKNIEEFFHKCGIKILRHNIARVDLCTDFVKQRLRFVDIANVDKWICRAKHYGVYYSNRKCSGISYGKGDLIMRVYDKRLELSDRKSTSKESFFNDVWSDSDSPVTRIEFQIRREAIKTFRYGPKENKIETIYDLLFAQNALWSYCVNDWVRHTAKPVDWKNKNHARAKISKFWEMVRNIKFRQNNPGESIRRKKKENYVDVDALVKQGVGCLVAASACSLRSTAEMSKITSIALKHFYETFKNQLTGRYREVEQKIQTVINSNQLAFD